MLLLASLAALAAASNVLLITSDQHRTDAIGCYGSSFPTPNLDQLAHEGLRYTQAHTASPVCMSARASWLTGTQVPVHNVWMNGVDQHRTWPLDTVVAQLKRHGYYTAVFGKTHYDPMPAYDHADVHSGNMDMRKPDTPVAEFLETYLVNRTMDLLAGRLPGASVGDRPWYIHVSFVSPHPPSNVPLEWQGRYTRRPMPPLIFDEQELSRFPNQLRHFLSENPGGGLDPLAFPGAGQAPNWTYIAEVRRNYYELSGYVDEQVGRLLRFLNERGLANSTTVLFTADHGTNLYDHGLSQKYNFFDPSWRVPLLVRGPGVPVGVRGFASGVDVPATVLAAAGVPRPPGLQGFDLRQAMPGTRFSGVRGASEASGPRAGGVAAALLQGYAVVTSSWKLTYYLDDGRGQLFRRLEDPSEARNLFGEPAVREVQQALLQALLRWRAGLEPVAWLQAHFRKTAHFWDTEYALLYTKNLTGMEPEQQLQADLLAVEAIVVPPIQGPVPASLTV